MSVDEMASKNAVFEVANIRDALAGIYPDSTWFEVGEMCDASEAFDEIIS